MLKALWSRTLVDIVGHLRDREYMSGVERDAARIKANGEVFTPTPLVNEILDRLPQDVWDDPTKTFCDPACGDGQFLSEVLIRKLAAGHDFEQALGTIYGVDLMQDNVDECRRRLLCGRNRLWHIVAKNIVCADGLSYDWTFGETNIIHDGMFEF